MPKFRSKWRDRFEKHASGALPKPTKAPFGSFVGDSHRHPLTNEPALRDLWSERFAIIGTPPEAAEVVETWPRAAFIQLEDQSILLVANVAEALVSKSPVEVLWEGGAAS